MTQRLAALFLIGHDNHSPSSFPSSLTAANAQSVNQEIICTVGPNGEQDCQAVYFDSAFDAYVDVSDEEDDGPPHWSELAVGECQDYDADQCHLWATDGECDTNPGYMTYNCPRTCDTCRLLGKAQRELEEGRGRGPCTDQDHECSKWAATGECKFNPKFMLVKCERSCMVCFEDTNQFGEHQETPHESDELYESTVDLIKKTTEYMKQLWADPEQSRVNYKCRNLHKDCTFWAAAGECEANPNYMQTNCAPACQTCNLLDIRIRCPILPGNEPVLKPKGLNALFEKIVDNANGSGEYLKYNPKALSRPKRKGDGTIVEGVEKDGPWVITLENFVSDEEAKALISAGHKKGYERSSDVGIELPDGTHTEDVNDDRTSFNAWCDEELCSKDPIISPLIERIASMTETHPDNSEHLQLLKYEPGQFYKQHHDYIEYQEEMPCGVRMLTFFLYLNDVEEGGETRFPLLNISVKPKKGRAVLWTSVLDEAPESKDGRTDHEALPVIKGVKYGANAWIHSRNYTDAEHKNCA